FLTCVCHGRGNASRSAVAHPNARPNGRICRGPITSGEIGSANAQQESIMKNFAFVGALVLAFVLGGASTLVGVPHYQQVDRLQIIATISPAEMHRAIGALPETVVENYI